MLPIGSTVLQEDVDLTTPYLLARLPVVTMASSGADYLAYVEFTLTNIEDITITAFRAFLDDPDTGNPEGVQVQLATLTPPAAGVPAVAFIRCPVRHGEAAQALWIRSNTATTIDRLRVDLYRQDVTHPVITDASVMLVESWRLVDLFNLTEGEQRVAGATLTVTSSSTGAGVVARTFSDASGLARLFLPPGTYYRWAQHTQVAFTNPTEFVVTPED